MKTPYRIKQVIGSNYSSDPDDIWATKHSLRSSGYYKAPIFGMTEYPDQQLIDAIKGFQHANNLQIDGVMKPNGETESKLLTQDQVAMTYWCGVCGAPHGGVNSPGICWQCWGKGYR